MLSLSLAWFILLTYILLKASYAPTVNQWWKDHARLERDRQKDGPDNLPARDRKSEVDLPLEKEGDYSKVNFDALAGFAAETPDISDMQAGRQGKRPATLVPPAIRSLDGHKVAVAGFMIPLISERDQVLCFILAQSRMTCCYGMVPKLNQWIYVTMGQGKSAQQLMDVPVTVFGTIGVGPKYDEENKGWCLYRMTGDKVDLPKASWF